MSVRYYIAQAALSYGIIKLFALQMPFPSLSLLSTPLGDLLPMRFSWVFIGYSVPYEFFSGAMETVAGLLLLYRRTITAGLFAATGAFMNVVMINLAYDVPVKLFASHLLFACLFLLALDAKRLLRLLVLNQPVAGDDGVRAALLEAMAAVGRDRGESVSRLRDSLSAVHGRAAAVHRLKGADAEPSVAGRHV